MIDVTKPQWVTEWQTIGFAKYFISFKIFQAMFNVYVCMFLIIFPLVSPPLKTKVMKEIRVRWPTSLMAQRNPPLSDEKLRNKFVRKSLIWIKINIGFARVTIRNRMLMGGEFPVTHPWWWCCRPPRWCGTGGSVLSEVTFILATSGLKESRLHFGW